jgi:hypothetical protein
MHWRRAHESLTSELTLHVLKGDDGGWHGRPAEYPGPRAKFLFLIRHKSQKGDKLN